VSNPPPLPASSPLPPSNPASAGGTWDRLEANIKVLQQQALVTQKAIQQINSREAAGPLEAAQTALTNPAGIDSTLVSASAVLGLSLVLLGWYVWIRPKGRLDAALARKTAPTSNPPASNPPAMPTELPAATSDTTHAPAFATPMTADTPSPESLFARVDPNMGFDSEAAATEVVRVRKSLAEKREARAIQLEREDADPAPSAHAWLDLDTPDPMDSVEVNSSPIPMTPLEPEPEFEADIALDLDPTPAEPEHLDGPDFSITLALAQESEALDLWPEARELATEVLDSSDATRRAQAQALLARLDQLEHALALQAMPPPTDEP
jgi:hypothetical protein